MALLALGEAAAALLELIETTAAAEDVVLPERRYVTASAAGNEAWDCEQVVVALLQLNPATSAGGQPQEWIGGSHTAGGSVTLPELFLQAQIVRCIPTVKSNRAGVVLTTQVEEHAAGLAAMQDAALLHAVRVQVMKDASLTGGAGADVRLGAIIPSGGEGGYAGVALLVGATMLKLASP